MKVISVVIVTWNRANQLKRCLNSLVNFENENLIKEIIIVDNNSSDNTCEIISQFQSSNEKFKVNYIKNLENLGCPIARNIGLQNVTSEYAYCLDDDGWLEINALSSILMLVKSYSDIAVAYSKILEPEGHEVLNHVYKTRPMGVFNAGATLYKMSVLKVVGLFPEYKRQMEESHLAFRIIAAGYKIYSCDESVMFHNKQKNYAQRREELKLNFLNEFLNYKDLFPSYFVLIIFLLRIIRISKEYRSVKCTFFEFLDDVKYVMIQTYQKKRRYFLDPTVYFKFVYVNKK